ncbi:peptidylprolyl isomerase [Candidatus Puniceispirillum sp.]|nr:peptidylprolyl isomerase [Candidatus Puniceispirillum sp.]
MTRRHKLFAVFALCSMFFVGARVPHGQAALEIVAKVNGKAITNYDVDQRAAFLRMVTNLDDTKANRQQIKQDATQMLIDEILKLEAAKAVDPNIVGKSREAAKNLLDENFADNGKSGSHNLRDKGIDARNIQSKLVSDIVWGEFIRYKFDSKFRELESIVDKALLQIKKNSKQPQVRLSEIILLPGPKRPMDKTLELANEIIKSVNRGANFNGIARQYSAAGTARSGGSLGWVLTNQLPPEINEEIQKIEVGEISAPIQRDGLVILIRKEGTLQNGAADPSQDVITIARAVYPLKKNASNASKLEAAAKIERETEKVKNCDDLVALNQNYGSKINGLIKNVKLGSFNTPLQNLIKDLEILVPSKPLSFVEGVSVFMLCKREAQKMILPAREDVFRAEFDKIFGSLSERYLFRLRRSAIIETDL